MAPVLWSPEAVAGVGNVADARWAPGGAALAWVRATPVGVVLVVDGVAVPDLVPAGTRGGAYTWEDDDHLLMAGEGGLHRVHRAGRGPGPLVAAAAGRAAAPAACAASGLVAFVDETDESCRVMVAPLDGSREPWPVSAADFAFDPAWSPDGRLLAWHEWDDPAMPWDGSRIVVGSLEDGGRAVVAGGASEAVGQPRFAPGRGPARLACVRDRDGWLGVSVSTANGREVVALSDAHEHAEPTWGPGQRSFAWSPDGGRIAWCRNEGGFGRLVVAPVGDDAGAASVEVSKGWHHGLDWGPAGLVGVRSGARTPPSVVVLTPRSGEPGDRRVVERAVGADAAAVDGFVEPQPVTWTAEDGATVHGLLFSPPGAGPPPLLVHLHGGPTDQTRVEWAPRLQYWVARGWAVLAPNPRGSTGYGRAYAQALKGGWGERDVGDVLAGLRAATDAGWGDASRVALSGGSAGGYIALLVAVRAPERVRAIVASYPVTDLVALAADTHRFERHYNDSLVGPLPAAAPQWRERSPLSHAAALRAPVLVLQGDDDAVVPLGQSVAFVDAVRAAGGRAELHVYPGEGHGWKHSATIADAVRRSDEFLTRWTLTGGAPTR